ncbi:MAG: MATE family efflux transporter, partial [Cyanobacteria bacterium KgW148]|nr:MATE family efflux transporter [Cyanobacteria bacterium KgW148]
QFTIQGIGMTTQTLVGRLYKEGKAQQMLPLIQISIIFSTTIALLIGLITVAFPKFVFSLLTNHLEIQTAMESYDFWLLPLLIFTAVAFMLEGYFIGLKEGTILRNSSIYSFLWGFLPLAGLGVYYQNNHLLWAALTLYMLSLAISLALQLPQTQRLVSANFSETAP